MRYSSDKYAANVTYTPDAGWVAFVATKMNGEIVSSMTQSWAETKSDAINTVLNWIDNEGAKDMQLRKIREILEHE